MGIDIDDLYTLEEYAEKKKISLKTVYNRIEAGVIQPIKKGKTMFIRKEKK
jgi:hypothetical protein